MQANPFPFSNLEFSLIDQKEEQIDLIVKWSKEAKIENSIF